MVRIFSIIILLASVGFITAETAKPCPDETRVDKSLTTLKTVSKRLTELYDFLPGSKKEKFNEFTETWTNIAHMTTLFIEASFPEHCIERTDADFEKVFGNLLRFLQGKSKTSEKEYMTYTDPAIIQKIENKATELDACFENSWDSYGVRPGDNAIHFCNYNMEESIDCAKKFFENDPDEPLLGMTTFANYFVKEFDCDAMVRDAMKYSIGLVIYEGLTENKEKPNERQSFFKGFQKAAHDFTKYEK